MGPTDPASQQDYVRRDEMLKLLVEAKTFSTSGTSNIMSFIPAPASTRGLPAAVIRAELDSFIQTLDGAGLLSARTKEDLLQKNKESKFGWKIEVAEFAYVAANEEYFLRPEKLKRFADQLHAAKVISDTNYQVLMQKSARGELHRYAELPSYLDFCITISTKELPTDSIACLRALYAATAKVFPGLDYDSIGFEVKKDEQEFGGDFVAFNLVTTIRKAGRRFSYSGYYTNTFKGKADTGVHLPDRYHLLFNKVLADLSSPYRLHSFPLDHQTNGIIALTEEQFSHFNWSYDGAMSPYLQVSYEEYAQGMTQDVIRSAIRTYDSLGLFAGLSAGEKDSCIAAVDLREVIYYSDVLKCFKYMVLDIDAKYGIDSAQYAGITGQAALISKGRFRPGKIIDGYTYEHPHFVYGFTLEHTVYAAHLFQDGKYLDPGFWDLIKKAVKEKDKQGAFYYIYPTDGFTVVYLTTRQYAFLKAHQLLEFTDPDTGKALLK